MSRPDSLYVRQDHLFQSENVRNAGREGRAGWALIILDLGVDTTTPSGEMIANVMATFAQFERRLIGQRTRDALAVKKRQGARLGRPVAVDEAVAKRIARERRQGRSLRDIADGLNEDKVVTGHGGAKWHASTVKAVLDRVVLSENRPVSFAGR
jgi:DNA invertase Pin-like site-specific DNA recombinase